MIGDQHRLLTAVLVGIVAAAASAYTVRGAVLPGRPLTAPRPTSGAFSIRGSASGMLYPGRGAPLDLVLTNRNGFALRVRHLSAAVAERTSNPGCSGSVNFRTRGLRGSFVLPARTSSHLSALGVPQARMPRIVFLRRAMDQGACEGARLSIAYAADAIAP